MCSILALSRNPLQDKRADPPLAISVVMKLAKMVYPKPYKAMPKRKGLLTAPIYGDHPGPLSTRLGFDVSSGRFAVSCGLGALGRQEPRGAAFWAALRL